MLLIFAALLGHDLIGESGEKILTLLGATLVAIAHWANFGRCKHNHGCIKGMDAQCD
jgi:hypothetical protein